MQRLVYSPKVYAFVEVQQPPVDSAGRKFTNPVNLSDYIISGDVKRVLDQVSTAELTIRNPQKIWTPLGNPVFTPMDKITIFLERLPGHPVQVFTGFLDSVPYFQMYPGPCTLTASCTLKRLLHTYFDPALPFMTEFMAQYGWIAGDGQLTAPGVYAGGGPGPTSDGSIGALLFAVLRQIGQWSSESIHIEALPEKLPAQIASLYTQLKANTEETNTYIEDLLKKIVGTAGLGTGDTTANNNGNNTSALTGKRLQVKVGSENDSQGQTSCFSTRFPTGEAYANLQGYSVTAVPAYHGGVVGDGLGPDFDQHKQVKLKVSANGKTVSIDKLDIGRGSSSRENAPMNLYPGTVKALGLKGGPPWTVEIQREDGKEIHPKVGADAKVINDNSTPGAPGSNVAGPPAPTTSHGRSHRGGKHGKPGAPGSNVAGPPAPKTGGGPRGDGSLGPTNLPRSGGGRTQSFIFAKGANIVGQGSWKTDQGVDIATMSPQDAPILAIGPGKIIASDIGGFTNSPANSNHSCPVLHVTSGPLKGYYYYGHCNMSVKIGDTVQAGQIIGKVGLGRVGQSSGPHIEFGFSNSSGTAPDPAKPGTQMLPLLKSLYAGHQVSGTGGTGKHGGGGYSALVGGSMKYSGPDQGIDFEGAGPVFALADGKITRIDLHSGWPGEGAILVYQMTSGTRNGQFIYIAEDFKPDSKLKVGSTFKAGDTLGQATGSAQAPGIEVGFAQNAHGTAFGTKQDGKPGGPPPVHGNEMKVFVEGLSGGAAPADGSSPSGSGVTIEQVQGIAKAAAFSAIFDFPTAEEKSEAQFLKGEKSYMNDKPLFPFIEQLCQGSLRHFQSMPNGNFFAFFPDYFGGLTHRAPYWEIDDIEILDGKINLTDDNLITHMYVVGDTYGGGISGSPISLVEKGASTGVVSVANAGVASFINPGLAPGGSSPKTAPTASSTAAQQNKPHARGATKSPKQRSKKHSAHTPAEGGPAHPGKKGSKTVQIPGGNIGQTSTATSDASDTSAGFTPFLNSPADVITFLTRYGVRPKLELDPFIRSHYFETFLAFQKFMLAWSRQFLTTFTFTFMPEIFPGGRVSFPNHGLQCYVEQVQHSFDYANGFTTQANLSAPASLPHSTTNLSRGLGVGQPIPEISGQTQEALSKAQNDPQRAAAMGMTVAQYQAFIKAQQKKKSTPAPTKPTKHTTTVKKKKK